MAAKRKSKQEIGTAPKPGKDGWVEVINQGGVTVKIPKEDLAYLLRKHPDMQLAESHHAPKSVKQIKQKYRMTELKAMLEKVPDLQIPEFATHDGLASLYLQTIGESE